MNGRATEIACTAIVERLRTVAAEILDTPVDRINIAAGQVMVDHVASELSWEKLVFESYFRRVSLSAAAGIPSGSSLMTSFAKPSVLRPRRSWE